MKNRWKAALLLLGTALFNAPAAQSQIVPKATVVGTGAVQTATATHRVVGTFGQAVIGLVEANPTTVVEGFWYALPAAARTSVTETPPADAQLLTLQSFPNPFAESTQLSIHIPKPGHASLILYNSLGQPVRTLLDAAQPEGITTLMLSADDLSAGNYTAILKTASRQRSISLTLIK